MKDEELVKEVNKIMNGEIGENFSITQNGVLTMKGRGVLDVDEKVDHGKSSLHSICYASR